MKILQCIILMFVITSSALLSQSKADSSWMWTYSLSGKNMSRIESSKVDADGNVYSCGRFQGTKDFGNGFVYTVSTGTDNIHGLFITKNDKYGELIWARQFSAELAEFSSMVIDNDKNIYICGRFDSKIDFGNDIRITGSPRENSFLTKFDSDGKAVWVEQMVASNHFKTMAIDANNNIYMSGSYYNHLDFGDGFRALTTEYANIYVCKYNSRGVLLWLRTTPATDGNRASSIAIDIYGNSFICGYFKGTKTFANNIEITSNGGYDAFIAKYDSNGVCLWAKKAGNSGNGLGQIDVARAIAVNKDGEPFMCGSFVETADFGNGITLTSAGGIDIFIAKYSSNGDIQWAKRAGTDDSTYMQDQANAIVIDSKGNPIITGMCRHTTDFGNGVVFDGLEYQNSFFAKYDTDGNVLKVHRVGSKAEVEVFYRVPEITNMNIDAEDALYFSGKFGGSIYLGNHKIESLPNSNGFIAKYSEQALVGIDEEFLKTNGMLSIHPNPAHSTSRISFKITAPSHTRLTLTDVLGRQTLLKEETLDAGEHSAEINTAAFPAGIYILTLEAEGQTRSQTIVIER